MNLEYPRYLKAGEDGLVVEFGDSIDPEINFWVLKLEEILEESQILGIEELIPTYRSLFVSYNPLILSFWELQEKIKELIPFLQGGRVRAHKLVRIPVAYGGEYGPDLEDVAKMHGLTEKEVIDIHTGKEYLVYMLGFTPGFPYMGVVPAEIATPRLENPRVKVSRGSVGIAESQTGIYPLESPGGWRIIGRTPIEIFNPIRKPPFLLSPGDRVRFFAISLDQFEEFTLSGFLPEFEQR